MAANIPPAFQLPRLWTWLARVLSDAPLLQDRAAPQLIAAVIETGGDKAAEVWGKQIGKVRVMLGKKCFEQGSSAAIGGKDGNAGRVRLGLVLEKWDKEKKINPAGRQFDT